MNRQQWLAGLTRLAACLGLLLLSSACGPRPSAVTAGADLPGTAVPVLESPHIPYIAASHDPYNSSPPTSGAHVPQTIATGVYREEIPEEIQVHALEHGHVLIQYAPATSAEEIRLLERMARRYPREVVVAPFGHIESGIALTAWGRLERMDHVDSDRISAFIEAHAGRYSHGWRED